MITLENTDVRRLEHAERIVREMIEPLRSKGLMTLCAQALGAAEKIRITLEPGADCLTLNQRLAELRGDSLVADLAESAVSHSVNPTLSAAAMADLREIDEEVM